MIWQCEERSLIRVETHTVRPWLSPFSKTEYMFWNRPQPPGREARTGDDSSVLEARWEEESRSGGFENMRNHEKVRARDLRWGDANCKGDLEPALLQWEMVFPCAERAGNGDWRWIGREHEIHLAMDANWPERHRDWLAGCVRDETGRLIARGEFEWWWADWKGLGTVRWRWRQEKRRKSLKYNCYRFWKELESRNHRKIARSVGLLSIFLSSTLTQQRLRQRGSKVIKFRVAGNRWMFEDHALSVSPSLLLHLAWSTAI